MLYWYTIYINGNTLMNSKKIYIKNNSNQCNAPTDIMP